MAATAINGSTEGTKTAERQNDWNRAGFESKTARAIDSTVPTTIESNPKKNVFQATVPKIGSSANLVKFLVPTMIGGSKRVYR